MNPKREEAGAEGPSGSAGEQPPQQPPQAQPQTPEQKPNGAVPDGYVPIEQFRAVTSERDGLKREKDRAAEEQAEKQGEWQKLAEKREAESKGWQERFTTTARRAAFVAAAAKSGKVNDPAAAYKLAVADGRLADVKVDDEGEADGTAIAKALDDTVKAYEFLKPGSGSFGGERGSTQPEQGTTPDKMTGRERIEYGLRKAAGR